VTVIANTIIRARSKTPRTKPRRPTPIDATPVYWNCNKPGYFATIYPEPRKINIKEVGEESYKPEEGNELRKEEP
jgi:hypothetical protein